MIEADVIRISEKLDISANKLYMLSNNYTLRQKHRDKIYRNYHTVIINHGHGNKERTLSVPNAVLKTVQRRILEQYLYQLEVSEYSTAYCKGKSLLDNASPHIGKECVLKLDISHFFDSIDDDMVYIVMKRLGLSVHATSLLTHLCTYKAKLPQGTPTSPYIANLVMKQFDEKLGHWCSKHNITYTRYCDDMTFSGEKTDILSANVVGKVKRILYRMGFMLNDKKTVFISSSQQQRVTGVVVNEKPTLSRSQKRALRQEVYYCQKYGVSDSINRRELNISTDKYLHSLLGRIAFALQIEPDNSEIKGYFETVKRMI